MSVKIIKSTKGNIFEQTKRVGLLCLAVEEVQAAVEATLDGKFAANGQGRRIAFIFRTQEQFNDIFTNMAVKPAEGVELPGIVVVTETQTPVDETDLKRGAKVPNKTAAAAGIYCTKGGKYIYRDTLYTTDETKEDTLIEHDNAEVIKAFTRTMNAAPVQSPALASASPVVTTGRRGNKS